MAIRRRNLREFQARLTERIQNASAASKSTRLGVLINEKRCLVDLEEAGEILSLPASTTKVPGTKAWFKGLISHRGALYCVTDLAQFEGQPASKTSKDSRLVTFNPKLGLNTAIVVSRMLGLQNLNNMKPQSDTTPSELQDDSHNTAWVDQRGDTWHEIKFSLLASNPQFLAVSA